VLQAGLDYMINDQLFININLRYIDIEANTKVHEVMIGKAEINPTTVGVSLGYRFFESVTAVLRPLHVPHAIQCWTHPSGCG